MLREEPSRATGAPAAGTGPGKSYLGYDFRNAYAPGVNLNGSGQTVGLVEFEGYYTADIINYEQLAGLPNVAFKNVLVNDYTGNPRQNDLIGIQEVSLDIGNGDFHGTRTILSGRI